MALIVVKFGGTSIGNGKRIRKAANAVVKEYMSGKKVVVVVSAINKTTDELIKIVEDATKNIVTEKQLAEVISMGEMTSARIFASAIESFGVKSEYIDPFSDKWPIITDSNLLNAEVDLETTKKLSKNILNLLDEGIIPVICGFLGKDKEGHITTLGRGGSDVTAFVLAKCLNADEVIIVTDVSGVMTTDPNLIKSAKRLEKISVEEMRDLATHGAKVLHPDALKYKEPNLRAKIISFKHGDLSAPGTEIIGPSKEKTLKTTMSYPEPLSVIAVVGEEILYKPGILAKITSRLAKDNINILGISTGQNSVTLFVNKKDARKAHKILHELVIKDKDLSSVSIGKDVGMISVSSPDFVTTPGIISKITEPLKKHNINIVEISSSQTSIVIFVEWKDCEKVYNLVRDVLGSS
ncbi:aspartate kinase [Methanothermus fervidus DSM 2088]|uniref:Aspartokinase n=1 Tax=Methanothermus fervidus (strain ATCC 43054 / DSM 2088 / JCM 10308 / V24 S) TaxID=523846 RepID=E3GYU4_METFV|nr:aspartate kinase [Methanothermus fervidus]ADP77476.1 aspartate kinase [Methanothermus fervidus DSM 2088]